MRIFLIALAVVAVIAAAYTAWLSVRWNGMFPRTSTEIVTLTPAIRARLTALRSEHKYQPHGFPPLGYTHPETAEDEALLNTAVNNLIDAILARPDGPVPAREVADLIGQAGKRVKFVPTEDRERAYGYMTEIWYILGFKGATGHFAQGAAFSIPPGYAEPLPPGWTSPDRPRPIG